jgi:RimJ/RimL family protein N-acetyltransferase
LGIVIGDRDYWSGGYGYDAVVTLLHHMFDDLRLKRVYLHTLDWNHRAQKCFERSGFNPVREVRRMSHNFILMEVLRDDWDATSEERLALRQGYLDRRGGIPVGDDDAVAAEIV